MLDSKQKALALADLGPNSKLQPKRGRLGTALKSLLAGGEHHRFSITQYLFDAFISNT